MNQDVLAQVLSQLRFSSALPKEAVDHLASAATLRGYPGGTELFRENSQNNELVIISIGRVALDMYVPGRGNVRILSLGPGDVVAWSALLAAGRMTTSATALEDTQVVSIAADVILAVCESNHTFGYQLMRRVASALGERLLATRLQLLDLFGESSPAVPWEPQIQ
jgi:CRP/FNR family cyclic AMP-dependent transcriptional regulator